MVNGASIRIAAEPNSFMISTTKEVVPENEPHEGKDQEQASAIDRLHRPFRHRTALHGLKRVEDEMSSVEGWNRQKIENSDADREQRDKLNQPLETELGGLPGDLGDLDRTAELALVLTSDDEAFQELTGPDDDVTGFSNGFGHGPHGREGDDARLGGFLVADDADHADLDDVSERVGLLHQL